MKIMKHLMRYEGYTTSQRVDDILDKISKYGMKSLTSLEKEFLDAHKLGKEEEIHKILTKEESENVFEDDNGLFKFELESVKVEGYERHYNGILTCPDLKLNGRTIKGRLSGTIIHIPETGVIIPDFSYETSNVSYDVFDFCEGNEYELDSFVDYVASELENRN
jgi:hypothetical protein